MITKQSADHIQAANKLAVLPAPEMSSTSPFPYADILPAQNSTGGQLSQIRGESFFSPDTLRMIERVSSLRNPPSPRSLLPVSTVTASEAKSIEERLFDATARVKILTAQVAMHLDREWRDKLFKQLDSLHDPDEWESEDAPLQEASFATFLKAIFQLKPKIRPGLGLSNSGRLLAAWTAGKNRLTIEFLPNDRVRWVTSRYPEDELEQFAGNTTVSKLQESLLPHHPEEWFGAC